MDNQRPSIEPELDAMLELLRETPERDALIVERGRAQYVADVESMFVSKKWYGFSWLEKLFAIGMFRQNRKSFTMTRSMKLSYSVLLVVMAIAFVLFSGFGITAYAAQSALPGDALYNVKMGIEQTQVMFAADAGKIAELHLGFADRRLDEISGLIAEGRYGEIDPLTQEFEYHVQQALIAMQTVAAGDPVRAQELTARVIAALTEYARSLSGMMMNVPDSTRASMQRAIITSQNARNLDPTEFGEQEIENVNQNINGSDDISNGDDQDSDQSNQNGNHINENDHDTDEGNTNLNTNENEDNRDSQENVNDGDEQSNDSNQNDQDNDNLNDSGDDNDNGDDDSNNNENDQENDNEEGGDDSGGGD